VPRLIDVNRDDLKLALAASASAAVYSAVFGALAVQHGWTMWQAVAASLFVHAGGSQFASLGAWTAGGSVLAAIAVGTLVNLRLGAFGFALGDVFTSTRQRLAAAHLVADESVAAAIGSRGADRRRRFIVVGLILFTGWIGGTAVGAVFGELVPAGLRDLLDGFAIAAFAAMLAPMLRDRSTAVTAAVAVLVAVATVAWVPAGLPVIVAAAVAVPLARYIQRDRVAA
jgi:predicted branched-subunit amino acid permease